MKNIGKRIKALRQKKDMTQEKVADLLGVTYQSVSKWETGVTYPDLWQIVPLANLLGVTTDELLGVGSEERTTLMAEYEERYKATLRTGDISERLVITEAAVRDFPENMEWLCRYGWNIWCWAIDRDIWGDEFEAERERAIKIFDTVIGNTDDEAVKASAITGIVPCYCGKGDRATARRYVDMYPDSKVDYMEKEKLLSKCLEGEERLRQKQRLLHFYLDKITYALFWEQIGEDRYTCDAVEKILSAVIPDGNLVDLHHTMYNACFRRGEIAATEGREDEAVDYLRRAFFHAEEYDRITSDPAEYTFTSPLLDGFVVDTGKFCFTGTGTYVGGLREMCQRPAFDSLRDREEFQELVK